MPLAILVRTRREPALTQIMNAASRSGRGQSVSDHVERISGQPYGDFQSLADMSRMRKRCAVELRVKMDLSKLKSCRRSVTACWWITQKGFFFLQALSILGLVKFMKMRNSFARSISYLEHFLSLQKKKKKKLTIVRSWSEKEERV